MVPQRRQPSHEDLALCAHDLRGALQIISGYSALLRRGDLSPDEQERALDGIDAAIRRADRLVSDTLAGHPREIDSSTPVPVAPLVRQAAADLRASTGREVAETIEGDPVARAEEEALARILENLLGNAAKYAPEGTIDVTARSEGDLVVVEVADHGPGFPEAERNAVFSPFVRLERDEELPGTGLGLTIVRSAAERFGGRATISAREGGGAVVRVEIPSAG
jgi:signal transduction histidine kinase